MIALKLVRLIEAHSEELASGLVEKFQRIDKCRELCKVPRHELQARSREIYRNLTDWLISKTELDIQATYSLIGRRRAEQGVPPTALMWGFVVTKEHLWDFLNEQGLTDTSFEMRAALDLIRLTEQFFERAAYYALHEYEHFYNLPLQEEPEHMHVVIP